MTLNILFVSKLYPDSLLSSFQKQAKIGLDFAAHNLSMAIWTGFKDNGVDVDVLNTPQLGSWPFFHRTPFIHGYVDSHIVSVPYFNAMYVKRLSLERHVYKEMDSWCQKHNGKKIIFLYNFNYVGVAQQIKAKHSDVKFCMLITDLPQYMATKKGFFTSVINKTNHLQYESSFVQYKAIDGFVLLAKDMKEKLPIQGKKTVQIEGIYNNEVKVGSVPKESHKVIMYTGNLGVRYGIPDLLKAFMLIPDPNYRLWIRGNGECENLVRESSIKDNRIIYINRLTRKELTEMQQRATLMVNPVHSSEDFTRFFFPSKTLEYLASGTPTLMCKLTCLPEEYRNHLFFFNDESVEGMAYRIQEICQKTQEELDVFGRSAADFIYREKTPQPQVEKILLFFAEL